MQEYFEEAATCLNMNFVKLCFASSDTEMSRISNAYPALFLVSAASAALLHARGLAFDGVVALDLTSFYSALFAVGSVSLPDGLYILQKIASLYEPVIDSHAYKGLCISGMPLTKLRALLKEMSSDDHQLALIKTAPEGASIMGHQEAIAALEEEVGLMQKYKITEVDMGGGLYNPLFPDLASQVILYMEKIDFKESRMPVISPLTGKLISKPADLRGTALALLTQPLAIDKVFKRITGSVPRVYVGIPATRIKGYIQGCLPGTSLITMETNAEFETIAIENKEPDHVQ